VSESLADARARRLARLRPRTRAHLRAWIRHVLEIDIPPRAILPGSTPPLDYLAHAFFEPSAETPSSAADEPPAPPRDCVVWAPRGGGKTFYAALATCLDLLFKPGIEVRLLGGSLEQSRRMHAHLRALFTRSALAPRVESLTERRVLLDNGSLAEVLAQSEASVRGARPTKLRCDEVELFRPDLWQAAQLMPRSRVCDGQLVHASIDALSTLHRPHGLMAELAASCAPDEPIPPARRLFKWSLVDALAACPPARPCETCDLWEECRGRAKRARGHISIDDAIRMKRRAGAATWQTEMLCLRPRRDDLVYPAFDPDVHVVDADPTPDAPGRWIAGMDLGFRAPTVFLWAHVDESNVLRVVDERIAAERTIDEHIAAIRAAPWPMPAWVGVDPAGHQRSDQTGLSPAGVLRRAGFVVRTRRAPLRSGLLSVSARLAPAFGPPCLLIHRRCEGLIDALSRYHFRRDDRDSDEPAKDGPDHAADALRYLITNLDAPRAAALGSYL